MFSLCPVILPKGKSMKKSLSKQWMHSTGFITLLVVLRTLIGWHFLYEGLAKLFSPEWSSASYLILSRWLFADFFHWIAANPTALAIADGLNIIGLIMIGLALMTGVWARWASMAGMLLLGLYYISNPPFIGFEYGMPTEGHYLVVNKNLVELAALGLFAFLPSHYLPGLGRLMSHFWQSYKASPQTEPVDNSKRELVKNLAIVPVLGGFVYAVLKKRGYFSQEEAQLQEVDAVTSATMKSFNFSSLQDLQGEMPRSKIKEVELSRLILGGNLIGGWAHARDLIYASSLVKAYHSEAKIFETFMLAERCGVNTVLTNPLLCNVINKYWQQKLGKIQFISDCGGKDLLAMIQKSIDNGACACYIQGGVADTLVAEGKFDLMNQALELIWQNGLPAGIGGHRIETIKSSVNAGLVPDFWMKTLHSHDYWSAEHRREHDNVWCYDPQQTIEFMESLPQPWIAFKTLAAGAISPEQGFRYAFNHGADFICVGMYDFQMVDDVNLACNILSQPIQRNRPWRA
jgi:uncharacterized membrane protein YphA (DoxX/SURF4 family)